MLLIVVCPLDCIPSFKLSNMSMEACLGFNLLLECIIEGPMSTVFHGNLMNCSNSNNEIALLHSRFNQGGTCNNGKVLGQGLPINDSENCHTSLLCIMVTPDMIGKTVGCTRDNGTTTVEIGNYLVSPNSFNTTATTITPATGNSLTCNCIGLSAKFK